MQSLPPRALGGVYDFGLTHSSLLLEHGSGSDVRHIHGVSWMFTNILS